MSAAGSTFPAAVPSSARMRRAVLASLLLLTAGCRTARGTADEPVVLSLTFRGVKAVDQDDLRAKLATQAPRHFWNGVERLDPDALALDRRRVEAFYREHGYYAATVQAPELVPAGAGRVRVVFRVHEGAPVRVSRVVVEGLDDAPAVRVQAGPLALQDGMIFSEAAYDATKAQLERALATTGYATAKVTQAAQVLPEERTAAVTYRVEPGPRFRLGRIFVAGTSAVPRQKVVAQAEREARAGDWYDEQKLELMQKRVFDLGVFAGVRVNAGEPDPVRRTVPVVVAVREAPFRTLALGPGFGFQKSRWEAQGQVSWTHRNWLGGLRRLQLDAKGGYAWLPPARQGTVGKVSAEFAQPGAVLSDRVDLTARVEVEKVLEQAYGSITERLRLGAPFRPATRWSVSPSYNLEVYRLRDLTPAASGLPQVEACPSGRCLLSYLEQAVTWDGRDQPLATTRGLYLSLAVQEGFTIGSLGYRYLRFLPETRVFLKLGRGTVLAARVMLGALVPIGETGPAPVVALFTGGGAMAMRGYGADRLSPMTYLDGSWLPTGGNGLLEGNLELRQDLGGDLGGVLFLDGGNVSGASGSPGAWRTVLDVTSLQLAAGVGVRYRTPFGPVRFDVAGRLPTDWSAGVPFSHRFPTVPGSSGHREPIVTLNLTLGEAF